MRQLTIIAVLFAAACATDEVDPPGVDGSPEADASVDAGADAAVQPIGGTWNVADAQCVSSTGGACQAQWFDSATGVAIDDATATLEWRITGPAGVRHAFVRSIDCAVIPVGTDNGHARDGYTLCLQGSVLEGTIGIARDDGGKDYWSVELAK